MDQLIAAFGIDWKLLVAQSVNFLVLVVLLTYFLYRPVLRMLADRAEHIATGVRNAELARAEREKIHDERSAVLGQAHHEAETIVARAEEEGKRERASILRQAQERAESIEKDAVLTAEETARRMHKEAEVELARAAVLAAEKILRSK